VPPLDATSLLYLYSNNSLEIKPHSTETSLVSALSTELSPAYKRSAETLHLNVARLIKISPSLGHIGFLTLTFKDNVTDHKEANRRFNSFNHNFLKPLADLGHWIRVIERQSRGAWHYHLLIQTVEDIREGFNFDEYKMYVNQITKNTKSSEKRRLNRLAVKSANPSLRKLWSQLRVACSKYGFGRSEMLPIFSNAEAMSRYIGKYISKNFGVREAQDKGVRYVAYSQGWEKNSIHFQWNTEGSKKWRKKLQLFATYHGCDDLYSLSHKLGSSWAFKYLDAILELPDDLNAFQIQQISDKVKKYDPMDKLQRRVDKNYVDKYVPKRPELQKPVPF